MNESDRALLQEALEALNSASDHMAEYSESPRGIWKPVALACDLAIANITARLEQPAAQPTTRKATRDEKIVNPGVYEVPVEQPAAQPVAIPDRLYFSSRNRIAEKAGTVVDATCNAVIQATLDHLRETFNAAPAVTPTEIERDAGGKQ